MIKGDYRTSLHRPSPSTRHVPGATTVKRIVPIRLISLICFSHVDFHFVSAGFPCAPWRGECEIAAVVFERNVHRILSDRYRGIETGYCFREAASEHLESLIMLVKVEHDEDRRSIGTKPVGRFHWHDFVRTVKAQFLVESFRRRNGAEQALRWSVEVVGE